MRSVLKFTPVVSRSKMASGFFSSRFMDDAVCAELAEKLSGNCSVMGKCTKTAFACVYRKGKKVKILKMNVFSRKWLFLPNQNPSKMKKMITVVLVACALSIVAASCMSTGKLGCPTNTVSNKPFRS